MKRVLLVLVGALGDLAWRKFLDAARALESTNPNVAILLVDVPWSGTPVSLADELSWRIARRRIELYAEEVDARKIKDVSLKAPFGSTQFPWDVDAFFERCLCGKPEVLEKERTALRDAINDSLRYFMEVSAAGLMRYSADFKHIHEHLKTLKQEGWKIALLVATPPQAYATVVKEWGGIADRILLEKPAGCLDTQTMLYAGTDQLRSVAGEIQAPAQIATNDHYNSKLIVRIMDRVRDYHLFDTLLDPRRIKRIVIQLLEPSPLPPGRYNFYNGAGGAFGDMVPHLLQAVRAILGIPQTNFKIDFQKFYWARYDLRKVTELLTGVPYCYEPYYYQPLKPETETFVAFKSILDVEGNLIPLYCRTGKHFPYSAKTLRVDTQYGDTDAHRVSLIFDLQKNWLTIRDDSRKFIMQTGAITLSEPFESGVPLVDTNADLIEYKSVFDALVKSEWAGDALDKRYFPDVDQAADLSDRIFQELLVQREQARVLAYSAEDVDSYTAITEFLNDEAHWA